MKKLNFLGIGPKIAVVGFSWLAVAIYISLKFKPSFSFTEEGSRVLFYFGLALVITGALFYFLTVPAL
ncbi:MAG TPA: hypothetical protein VI583_06905, partial [Cyclobacteriaceae bacterium]|nr:hypothetical protein [Cyclobacteriaceae bacterium]